MKAAVFILGILGALSGAQAAPIDLTGDSWNLEGVDAGSNVWDGTTLVFDTQVLNGADYDLTGYFDWVGTGPSCPSGCSGREFFTGTFFSDLSLDLSGFEISDPVGIILGTYSALVFDELNIISGVWAGLNQPAIPGQWSASRVGDVSDVPLPAAAPLFASVLAGAFGWGASRRRAARS